MLRALRLAAADLLTQASRDEVSTALCGAPGAAFFAHFRARPAADLQMNQASCDEGSILVRRTWGSVAFFTTLAADVGSFFASRFAPGRLRTF